LLAGKGTAKMLTSGCPTFGTLWTARRADSAEDAFCINRLIGPDVERREQHV